MKTDKTQNSGNINLLDIFFYLISYWYFFVGAIALCVGFSWLKYQKSDLQYAAKATIVIKNPANTRATTKLDAYSGLINRTNVSNEILQFRSKRLMAETVSRLDANVSYRCKSGMRHIELYTESPVKVLFSDNLSEMNLAFVLSIEKDSRNVIKYGESEISFAFNDSVSIAGGTIMVVPTEHMNDSWKGRELQVNHLNPVIAAKAFLPMLAIEQLNEDASILTFVMQDQNARRACDIINTLVEVYNEDAIADKNMVAVNTEQFINERIKIIGQELGDVEERLQSFKTKHHVMSVDEAASQYLAEGRKSNAVIIEMETRIRLAEYVKDYLLDEQNTGEMIPTNIGIEDLRVEGLITQYNNMKMQRDRLVSESSEESPVIKGMDNSLASMKASIIASIDNLITSLNVKRDDAARQEELAYSKFQSMPSTSRDMGGIERQQNIKESLYIYLLNKREENALSRAMVDNNARVIDAAESSYRPVAPSRNKMLALGFLVGLLVPAVALLLRMALDSKVHTRKELEELSNVPIAGEIPHATDLREAVKGSKPILVYQSHDRGVVTESFRMLATNIDLMRSGERGQSLVVAMSSFGSDSGKTFVAMNQAYCFADMGKKVVLIDVDLRKRSLSDHVGLAHRQKGLSNYLYDNSVTVDEIMHKNAVDGFDFIPAGMLPPNPVELLKRERLDNLIAMLRKEYDYIILDSVPMDVVADPVIINRCVDVTVFVLRSGSVDRRMIPQLDEACESGKLNNMCLVMNATAMSRHYGYNYGYGYGYGSGYGYGYGYKGKDEDEADCLR